MAEIDAIHNQSKADGEPYHAKRADQEHDIAAVSAHRNGAAVGIMC
jgi:hypothetical protein